MDVVKQKKNEDIHMRLSDSEKRLIVEACRRTGAFHTSKGRELLVSWARGVAPDYETQAAA